MIQAVLIFSLIAGSTEITMAMQPGPTTSSAQQAYVQPTYTLPQVFNSQESAISFDLDPITIAAIERSNAQLAAKKAAKEKKKTASISQPTPQPIVQAPIQPYEVQELMRQIITTGFIHKNPGSNIIHALVHTDSQELAIQFIQTHHGLTWLCLQPDEQGLTPLQAAHMNQKHELKKIMVAYLKEKFNIKVVVLEDSQQPS